MYRHSYTAFFFKNTFADTTKLGFSLKVEIYTLMANMQHLIFDKLFSTHQLFAGMHIDRKKNKELCMSVYVINICFSLVTNLI
jgi:hypothetical protein